MNLLSKLSKTVNLEKISDITDSIGEKLDNIKQANVKKEVEDNIKNLPGMIAVLFSVSNVDGIDKKENSVIEDIYLSIIENARKLDIDNNLIQKAQENIKNILNIKYNITLSEALRYVVANKSYKKGNFLSTLDEALQVVIEADGKFSKEEEQFQDRFKLFLKNDFKAIEIIEQMELSESIPENYYLQGDLKTSNFKIHPSTKIITQNDTYFKNIHKLTPNTYYIIHPLDNSMLLAVDEVIKINDFIIDEFRSLASSLGAKKFTYTQEVIEVKVEDKTFFSKGGFLTKGNQGLDMEVTNKSDDNEKNTNKITKIAEFEGGQKATQEDVIKNLLWLKNNYSIEKLIEQVYSSNAPIKWEDEIRIDTYLKSNSSFDFDGTLKIASLNSGSLKSNYKNNLTRTKNTVQHIIIEF